MVKSVVGRFSPSQPVLQGTFRDLVRSHERRRRLFPRALLVGLVSGLVAVAFRLCLSHLADGLHKFVSWGHTVGWPGMIAVVSLGSVGGGIGVWIAQRYAPEIAGSGIPFLKAVVFRMRPMKWWRVLPLNLDPAVG